MFVILFLKNKWYDDYDDDDDADADQMKFTVYRTYLFKLEKVALQLKAEPSSYFIAYLTPVGLTDWAWTVYTVDE